MSTFVRNSVAALAIAGVAVGAAFAQGQPAGDGPPVLAKQIATARGGTRLLVSSGAFTGGEAIPDKYTQNGDNVSPAINWVRGPTGTQSFVVLAEDSGVNRHDPIVHWVVYDIPSTVTSLPSSMPGDDKLENGGMQGKNIAGKIGYIGPKPPAGQTHPYHFEVFALNTKLNLDPGADRNTVVNAMKGHVLAVGDLIGDYTGK
jgi:Raf kinase inhibitor-like YbhB/YbcL family protein